MKSQTEKAKWGLFWSSKISCLINGLEKKAHVHPQFFFQLRVDHALVVFASREACLHFGHSAALVRCVARALRPVRGWHRSECEWLALSPNINVKKHRWPQNSYRTSKYFCEVGGGVLVAFVSGAFFWLKNSSNWCISGTVKTALNVSFILR